ncbi:DUF2933 domain-containing protein [Ramlibacter sp.]|uniref:DUF2933 domain-containing protein n=1 Tax=Ramlibacter sp. TaxID=1917967 RepID=UPI0035B12400
MADEHASPRPSFWKSPWGVVCTVIAVAASAYLWLAHKDHLLALLPYAFLAACPLMHMFMHRGHHGHHHGGTPPPDQRVPRDD